MPELKLPVKLLTPETMEKLSSMAEEHADPDIRFLAETAAGLGHCVQSIADSFPIVVKFINDAADGRP